MSWWSQAKTTEMPPWLLEPWKHTVEGAESIYKQPYEPYKGARVAPFSAETELARDAVKKGQGKYKPHLDLAASSIRTGSVGFPKNVDRYMNPYEKHVIRQIAEEGNRNFKENVLPALEARFVRLGQHGGSRHAGMGVRAARDLQREIMDRQQQALASGYRDAANIYNTDMTRVLEGARQAADLGQREQASYLTDVGALEGLGRAKDAHAQMQLSGAYEDFLRQQNYPRENLSWLQHILHGTPLMGATQTFGHTTQPTQYAPNTTRSIGDLAGQLWAMNAGRQQPVAAPAQTWLDRI